jgi:hypothetical protein
MAESNRVFVSPGIYTSEKDLTFVAQSVGVTTLGLAGETLRGPAFEPILISNYDEFKLYFGGTSPEKDGNGNPKYQLPYVAKSYLQESNQLFVTRTLGLTGYKPNKTYNIVALGGVELSSTGFTSGSISISGDFGNYGLENLDTYSFLSGKTATNGDSVTDFINSKLDYQDNDWFTIGDVPTSLLPTGGTKITGPIGDVTNFAWLNNFYSGTTTGIVLSYLFVYDANMLGFDVITVTYTGATVNEYNNIPIAALRSRGSYSGETLNLQVTSGSGISISGTSIEDSPIGDFTLTVTGLTGVKTFECSLDSTSNKAINKVLGVDVFDKDQDLYPLYVHEYYPNLLNNLMSRGLIRGISTSIEVYTHSDIVGNPDFMTQWDTPASPMVVSEVRGGKVDDLFQVLTISDGNAANELVKITIANINLETGEFDILVRDFNDTDENSVVLERYTRCTMNSELPGYVALKVGTSDGEYELKSKYIMLSMAPNHPENAIPSGFKGFTAKNLTNGDLGSVIYKTQYYDAGDIVRYDSFGNGIEESADKIKRVTLGLSSQIGFDTDLFKFKGKKDTVTSEGFHLSVNASTITGSTITGLEFQTTPYDLEGQTGDNNKLTEIANRKFTFAVCGGYDGWDIYRKVRTNTDGYVFGKKTYVSGNTTNNGVFNTLVGNSDYYAYLQAIETFNNPEAVDINVFSTPGINFYNHSALVSQTIDMVENERADSLYVVDTPNYSTADEVVDALDTVVMDSNYTATYWPWIQVRDNDNSTQLYIPPTGEVLRNLALTDNVAYPWFATAGYSRGLVNSVKAMKKLTLDERDLLYKNRINPIATFADTGTIIWGNKTLQIRESALDRINVRRLLLRTRKLISAVSVRLLFEQNDEQVRQEFLRLTNPILESIKKERGLYDFRVTVSNDPEDYDSNTLRGKIYIKPTRSLEFVDLEFIITPTGASFENV